LHDACYTQQPFHQFRESAKHLLKWQEDGRCYWLVAERKRQSTPGRDAGLPIVGSGQLVIYAHVAEMANLAVRAEYRRQGIGTAAIDVLIDIACHLGLSSVETTVVANNSRALALYKRNGFKEVRRLSLPDGERAIILRQAL
jgi:ribosomal protein S18 acetylase RimI-like enzyme